MTTASSPAGHASNVANFRELVSFCAAYGADYQPADQTLSLRSLNDLYQTAEQSLLNVHDVQSPWQVATNHRERTFKPLNKLATRVLNALIAAQAFEQTVQDARSITRKIQGRRANAHKKPVATAATDPAVHVPKTISASQMGFDDRIMNFNRLIELVSDEPRYAPNEPDLQVSALTAYLAELRSANIEAETAQVPLSNARITRNKALYTKDAGLVHVAADVKAYIKSVFGARSAQYRQVGGLRFIKMGS